MYPPTNPNTETAAISVGQRDFSCSTIFLRIASGAKTKNVTNYGAIGDTHYQVGLFPDSIQHDQNGFIAQVWGGGGGGGKGTNGGTLVDFDSPGSSQNYQKGEINPRAGAYNT